jgi:hypothetical protein
MVVSTSVIVTDGVRAMVGEQKGFSGLLRKDASNSIFHCIIHQEALCGKSVQQSNCMKLVVKITSLIRGGNRSHSYRKFRSFLEETDASHGDMLLNSHIRWLGAGKCVELFFALRREIPLFLKTEISSDTTDLDQEMLNHTFLCELAFLSDITKHMNDLNMKLQGKQQNVSDLFGHVNGFRNKLKLFNTAIQRNDLTHFPCCKELAEDLSISVGSKFSTFVSNIEGMMEECKTQLTDFKNDIAFFHNPIIFVNEEQLAQLQLELCNLQADPILSTMKEKGMDLLKILPKETCPQLRDFGLRMNSVFDSTYLRETTFSNMKFIKSCFR